jgi:hypothetical protein
MSEAKETPITAHLGTRRLSNVFIAVFLAFQIAMPLRYYLGDHGYDERFSWRMFSTVRLQQCEMQISERGVNADPVFREVQVRQDVQAAWVNLLERVRMPVVKKYLERRCERQHATEVSYTRRCTDTDGSAIPIQTLRMDCSSRELSEAPP